jgi:hypothetical protein
MDGHDPPQSRSVLLTQRNIDEAAKPVGISAPTLISWMKVPEFDQAYRETRRVAFRQSVARLQQASGGGSDHAR